MGLSGQPQIKKSSGTTSSLNGYLKSPFLFNESRDSLTGLSCMNLHNVSLVDSCQEQQTAMNIGIAAGRVPHSLPSETGENC